jgi:hypothetical protein
MGGIMLKEMTYTPHPDYLQNAEIYHKAYCVIMSCKTEGQAKVAYAFMQLADKYLTEKQQTVLHEAYVTKTLTVTGVI